MLEADWLRHVVGNDCGMSIRPEYYSGRGALLCDLKPETLERVYQAILRNSGETGAKAFVRMVAAIPVLSATDFLIALETLEQNGFEWSETDTPADNGIRAIDEATAFGTIMSMMHRGGRDDTQAIRDGFLRRHGVGKTPHRNLFSNYDQDGYYIEHYEYLDRERYDSDPEPEEDPPPALALVDLGDEKG